MLDLELEKAGVAEHVEAVITKKAAMLEADATTGVMNCPWCGGIDTMSLLIIPPKMHLRAQCSNCPQSVLE